MPPLILVQARRRLSWTFLAAVLAGLSLILSVSWPGRRVAARARRENSVLSGKTVALVVLNETRAAELGIVLHAVADSESPVRVLREALQEDESGPFVWVEDFERKCSYLKTRVQPGPEEGCLVQITGGLLPGDPVVSSGAPKLRNEPSLQINHSTTPCDGSHRPSLYETVVRSIRKHLP